MTEIDARNMLIDLREAVSEEEYKLAISLAIAALNEKIMKEDDLE